MKKIFAIALALVMVLSMASAFASACVTGPFSWDCATTATNCGKATIEVIPLVKANDACADWKMMDSTCAAAVTSENVYYALKLTVDKNVDPEWYNSASLTVSATGVADVTDGKWNYGAVKLNTIKATPFFTAANDASEDGYVFYLTWDGSKLVASAEQTEATDKLELKDVYCTMKVGNAAKAKVCATIKAEFVPGTVRVGDYTVKYNAAVGKLWVANKDNTVDLVTYDLASDGKVTAITYNKTCGEAEYAAIKAFMGLEIGTCVTADAVKANFGWKDKQESCFSWSDKATAVVDAECVVAIPKTGDASVLAWLF